MIDLEFLQRFMKEINVFLLSMLPISELRGSIPLGLLHYKLGVFETFLLSYIGNLIPVIPVMFFLEKFSEFLSSNFYIFKKFFDWLFARTRRRTKVVEKYGPVGLMLFVAIPLPYTGAWTGAVCAFLFGIKKRIAFFYISLGVFIAGIIVTLLSLGIIKFV